ncbi:MAG TPA: hypothetical protein VJN88_02245 [Ktedonobacterales bacterium]|nr:hypothetical protein [Ktedonobacterales bacterium]
MPDSAVNVNLREAKASIRVSTKALVDYHDLVSALQRGPHVPASASYHIVWSGNQGTQHVVDPVNRFVSDVIYDSAQMEWHARNSIGFRFVSDPTSTSFSLFAQLAHERNGAFFSS